MLVFSFDLIFSFNGFINSNQPFSEEKIRHEKMGIIISQLGVFESKK